MVPMLMRDREDVDFLLRVAEQTLHHAGHDPPGIRRAQHDSAVDHQLKIVMAGPFHPDEDAVAQSLAIYAHRDATAVHIMSGGGCMILGRVVRAMLRRAL